MNLKLSQISSIATGIRSRAGRLALVAALAFGPTAARATVYTWTGASSSNHGWVQQANYIDGTTGTYTFTSDDTLYFSSASASYFQPIFGSSGTIGTLEFGSETGANPITITRSNSAVLTLASGILVDAGAGANTITTAITLSGATTTFTNNSSNILQVSVPTGSNQLSINGSNGGAFHFQAAQAGSFTGSTTVNSGATLRVLFTTTLGGTVDVKSGGTLGGRGTIGATEIESGATLAPGIPTVPASSINFSSSLTLDGGSISLLDLTNSGNDSVSVTNALTLGGELRLTLSDDFSTPGNYTLFSFAPESESGNFDFFNVYNSTGKIGELSRSENIWSGEVNGLSYSFDQSTGTLTAVPEPSTVGLAIAGLLAAIVFRARIHRKSSLPPAAWTGPR